LLQFTQRLIRLFAKIINFFVFSLFCTAIKLKDKRAKTNSKIMNFRLIISLFAAIFLINCTTNTTMTPELTTTAASQITVNGAISGGNLITDGGSTIIQKIKL
jgi:uncharacterized membrane protein YdcZ (DUF606 family)